MLNEYRTDDACKPGIFHPCVIQMNEVLTSDFLDPIRPQSKNNVMFNLL